MRARPMMVIPMRMFATTDADKGEKIDFGFQTVNKDEK